MKNTSNSAISVVPSVSGDAAKYFVLSDAKSYVIGPNVTKEIEFVFLVNDTNRNISGILKLSSGGVFQLPAVLIYDNQMDFFSSITGLFLFDVEFGGLGVSLWLLLVVGLLIGVFYFKNQKVKNALFLGIVVILFIVFSSQILNILGG